MNSLLRWTVSVVGVAVCITANLTAQVVPHPYEALVREERRISGDLDRGLVRRASQDLLQLRSRDLHTSAADEFYFRRSEAEQASGNIRSSDRTLERFTRIRPNSPGVPYAWVERGLSAFVNDDNTLASDYLEVGAQRAEEASTVRSDRAYVSLAHLARYWQGVSRARAGMFAEAIASFEQAAADSTGPYADRSLFAIGQVYERNGHTNEAILAYAQIRTKHPKGASAIAARIREAQNYLRLRQPERAVDVLVGIDALIERASAVDTAQENDPLLIEHAAEEVLELRTTALLMRGSYAMSADSCAAFLSRYPLSEYRHLIHLQAGYASLQLGEYAKALDHFAAVEERVVDPSSVALQQAKLYRGVALKRSQKTLQLPFAHNCSLVPRKLSSSNGRQQPPRISVQLI